MISGNDVQSLVGDDDIATDRTSEEQTVVGRRAAEPSASGDSSRDGAPRIATDRRTPMSGSSAVSPPQADTRDAGLKAVGKPGPAEHTDNEGTGEGRTSNPGTVLARQKERFGGMKAGSAFFGWLTATGTTVTLL